MWEVASCDNTGLYIVQVRHLPTGIWHQQFVTPDVFQQCVTPSVCRLTPPWVLKGLASEAILEQYRFSAASPDGKAWLAKAWPALDGTANATQMQRLQCVNCSGLLPKSGGDGGLPTGHIFVQEAGAL